MKTYTEKEVLSTIGYNLLVGAIIGSGLGLNAGLLLGRGILAPEHKAVNHYIQSQPEVIILERGSERLIRIVSK